MGHHPYGELVTTLPTWAVWVISIGIPVLAFVGVVLGQVVTRRGERELEFRACHDLSGRRREDDRRAQLGQREVHSRSDP